MIRFTYDGRMREQMRAALKQLFPLYGDSIINRISAEFENIAQDYADDVALDLEGLLRDELEAS